MPRIRSRRFLSTLKARQIEKRVFARLVRELLVARQWTHDDLARRVGVSRQAVSLWVTGQRLPAEPARAKVSRLGRR